MKYPAGRRGIFVGMALHLLGSGEAQDLDADFQNVLGQADEGDVACLEVLVLLGEDPGLVVELVDTARQFIDVGADQVGSGGAQGGLQGGASLVMESISSLAKTLAGA